MQTTYIYIYVVRDNASSVNLTRENSKQVNDDDIICGNSSCLVGGSYFF